MGPLKVLGLGVRGVGLALLLMAVSGSLRAQMNPRQAPEMAWNGDQVMLCEEGGFRVLSPHEAVGRFIPYPPRTIDRRFAKGQFWVVQEVPAQRRISILRSLDGVAWESAGHYTYPEDGQRPGRCFIYPLNEGRFMMVADYRQLGFSMGGKVHPIVTAKVDPRGNLQLEGPVDLGLKEPLVSQPKAPGETAAPARGYAWIFSMKTAPPFLTVGSRSFLCFPRAGALFEFRDTGSIARKTWVIPGLDETRACQIDSYDWALLCVQPTRAGDLLIASRTADGVLDGRLRYPRSYTPATMGGPGLQNLREMEVQALKAAPRIEWWTFDPESGQLYPTPPPARVPAVLKDLAHLRNFAFHLNVGGNLVFPDEPAVLR